MLVGRRRRCPSPRICNRQLLQYAFGRTIAKVIKVTVGAGVFNEGLFAFIRVHAPVDGGPSSVDLLTFVAAPATTL